MAFKKDLKDELMNRGREDLAICISRERKIQAMAQSKQRFSDLLVIFSIKARVGGIYS